MAKRLVLLERRQDRADILLLQILTTGCTSMDPGLKDLATLLAQDVMKIAAHDEGEPG